MDSHISRLAAAIGLAQFQYRAWSAPEIASPREAAAEPVVEHAPESSVDETLTPFAAPIAEAPARRPPVALPAAAESLPAFTMPTRPPPVTLPPPAPAIAPAAARAPGRPPVVLPPPEDGAAIVPLRPAATRRPAEPPPAARPPRRFALLDEIGPPPKPPERGRHPIFPPYS